MEIGTMKISTKQIVANAAKMGIVLAYNKTDKEWIGFCNGRVYKSHGGSKRATALHAIDCVYADRHNVYVSSFA
jgi:hypothetical protein